MANDIITAHLTDGRTVYFRPSDVSYSPAEGFSPACIILRQAWDALDIDPLNNRLDEVDELHDDPHHAVILAAYERHMGMRKSSPDMYFDGNVLRCQSVFGHRVAEDAHGHRVSGRASIRGQQQAQAVREIGEERAQEPETRDWLPWLPAHDVPDAAGPADLHEREAQDRQIDAEERVSAALWMKITDPATGSAELHPLPGETAEVLARVVGVLVRIGAIDEAGLAELLR
jgi:hypothetical protein